MKVIRNTSPARCDKCAWAGTVYDLDLAVNLQTRLDEGADYTPFQCPRCGALVYSLCEEKRSGKKTTKRRGPKT